MDERAAESEFEFGPELQPPDEEDGSNRPLLCWLCRQPIAGGPRDRVRGEPVHRRCLPE